MQHLAIYAPSTPEAVQIFAEKRGLLEYLRALPKDYQYPQEDAYIVSDNSEIAIVADGVTLNFNEIISRGDSYPNHSPAGEVARIFCEQGAQHLGNKELSVNDAFIAADEAVADYNSKYQPSPLAGNPTGKFAATAACAVVRGTRVHYASLCDAFVMHFDKDMILKTRTSGVCKPYAVINGDQTMLEHVEYGEAEFAPGDRIFVCTDGFEYYVQEPEFLSLFLEWNDSLEAHVREYMQNANIRNPTHFGHERTLVALKAD